MDRQLVTCLKCGTEIDYEPEYCCNGRECGCMGKPLEPPLCEECWDIVMNGSNAAFLEREGAPVIISSISGELTGNKAILMSKVIDAAFAEDDTEDDNDFI